MTSLPDPTREMRVIRPVPSPRPAPAPAPAPASAPASASAPAPVAIRAPRSAAGTHRYSQVTGNQKTLRLTAGQVALLVLALALFATVIISIYANSR